MCRPQSPKPAPSRSASRRSRLRAGGAVVLALAAGLQGGCVAALGAGTVVATGKTPVDHVYSWVTGKDCSVVRERRGNAYCVEDEVATPVLVHCYPTLGEVTCYAVPDPYPGGQRKLGSVPPTALPVLAARQPPPAPAGDPAPPPTAEPAPASVFATGRAEALVPIDAVAPAAPPTR